MDEDLLRQWKERDPGFPDGIGWEALWYVAQRSPIVSSYLNLCLDPKEKRLIRIVLHLLLVLERTQEELIKRIESGPPPLVIVRDTEASGEALINRLRDGHVRSRDQ